MEYQKIVNLLDNTQNQPSKFRTNNQVEANDDSRGRYKNNSQIKFQTSMIRSSSEDNNDAYILVKGTITVTNTEAECAAPNNRNKKVIFKNWASFTDCIIQTGQIENDGTKDVQIMVSLKHLSNF